MSAALDRLLAAHRFRGTALVRRAGLTLLDRGCGAASGQPRSQPNRPATAFQIASIGKQLTAAAILVLQAQDRLSAGDRVRDWIPACPAQWDRMTIHHLLTHTSGLGHFWGDFPEIDPFAPIGADALIAAIQARPLRFAPGAGWRYSSSGYTLLAAIAERAARAPYSAVLRRLVLDPIGMTHTWVGSGGPPAAARAQGHAHGMPTPSFDLDDFCRGAGDLWSTTGDLARWDEAVLRGELLDPAVVLAPHAATTWRDPSLTDVRCGYGWFLAEWRGRRFCYHAGDNAGFAGMNAVLPEDGVSIVLLSDEEGDLVPLALLAASLACFGPPQDHGSTLH